MCAAGGRAEPAPGLRERRYSVDGDTVSRQVRAMRSPDVVELAVAAVDVAPALEQLHDLPGDRSNGVIERARGRCRPQCCRRGGPRLEVVLPGWRHAGDLFELRAPSKPALCSSLRRARADRRGPTEPPWCRPRHAGARRRSPPTLWVVRRPRSRGDLHRHLLERLAASRSRLVSGHRPTPGRHRRRGVPGRDDAERRPELAALGDLAGPHDRGGRSTPAMVRALTRRSSGAVSTCT